MTISRWDVKALNESGEATWPENPEKCFYDYDRGCRNLTDLSEGEPIEDDINPPPWMFQNKKPQAGDFIKNRSTALETARLHSKGWDTFLNWDEYPLEIQCQRCFWYAKICLSLFWLNMFLFLSCKRRPQHSL